MYLYAPFVLICPKAVAAKFGFYYLSAYYPDAAVESRST